MGLKFIVVLQILTLIFVYFSSSQAHSRSLKNACEQLIYYAREGFLERPTTPRYFADPLLENRNLNELVSDTLSESFHQVKGLVQSFTDRLKNNEEASLIIAYNEAGSSLRPGIYRQIEDQWHEIPTQPMADARLYRIYPLETRSDGSIKRLHIFTFYFSISALPYAVILDDFDETTLTGTPKIIVRHPAYSGSRASIECIRASRGRLGLRVFARQNKNSGLILGSTFENAEELRESLIENRD